MERGFLLETRDLDTPAKAYTKPVVFEWYDTEQPEENKNRPSPLVFLPEKRKAFYINDIYLI